MVAHIMNYFESAKAIDKTMTPVESVELLNAVSEGLPTNSFFNTGSITDEIKKETRMLVNTNIDRTISDFLYSRYYYHKDTRYNVNHDKSFRLFKIPGQSVVINNVGKEDITVVVYAAIAGILTEKAVLVSPGMSELV